MDRSTSSHFIRIQNYQLLEAGTEISVDAEAWDPVVLVKREKAFDFRLGQLSTRYVSRLRAQENWKHPLGTMNGSSGLESSTVLKPGPS